MKKYIILLIAPLAFIFSSCQEEAEPGGTAVEEMAGDWWVTYQNSLDEYFYIFEGKGSMPSVNDLENWNWDYIYDDTHSQLLTYNTAANTSDKLYLTDAGHYTYHYKVKADVDYTAKTLKCDSTSNLASGEGVEIVGGKVLKGAATSPSGQPVDSIVFYIRFYNDKYGFTYTKVSGFRRTGFGADDF